MQEWKRRVWKFDPTEGFTSPVFDSIIWIFDMLLLHAFPGLSRCGIQMAVVKLSLCVVWSDVVQSTG